MTTNRTTTGGTTSPTSETGSRRASQSSAAGERRRSDDTWDASKVPPSQFQKRRGSILSTPNSKDGNVERGDRDKAYFEKLKEKGWVGK
ncbi:hypothetical protein BKA63DRAFT_99212 [Paraphoma chrysanthemicola]|nr:hypothetical protein BKA63DRAFT_99212 [Paraphoma chrysanthemicola]